MRDLNLIAYLNKFDHFNELFVGFNHQFAHMSKFHDQQNFNHFNYPPSNIKRVGDGQYQIELAVAGFDIGDFDISVEENVLKIEASLQSKNTNEAESYLFKGIGKRSFTKKFMLNEHSKVVGATLESGLLTVHINIIVPENKKCQKIGINSVKQDTKKEFLQET